MSKRLKMFIYKDDKPGTLINGKLSKGKKSKYQDL